VLAGFVAFVSLFVCFAKAKMLFNDVSSWFVSFYGSSSFCAGNTVYESELTLSNFVKNLGLP
jgi:hypothetical protein